MKTRLEDVAAALEASLCRRIGQSRYDLWFANKTKFSCGADEVVVGVANLLLQDWLQKTFGADIGAAVAEVLGRPQQPRFVIDPELFQAARQQQASTPPRPREVPPPSMPARREVRARRWRRLEDFVSGPCNRVAYASALNLVESPDEHPCPLVLHGPVGTGKTHLLEGVYSGLCRDNPGWNVVFLTAEQFTNRFLQAMHQHKLGAFRKQFRECDALLVDDLHFLARKTATQEEFLHTLDALHTEQRPVIVTCDCHPRLTNQFQAELTDRLLGGAVWGLNTPDHATRLQLLRTKSQALVPEPVLAFMAEHLTGNVRELEGAVHSLVHLSKVTRRLIDLELARESLGEVIRHNVRVVSLADVEQAVCAGLGIEADLLRSSKRGWQATQPRMLAMYLARKFTGATYSEVGKHFGGRNHSTVVAAEKRVRNWLSDNTSLTLGKQSCRVRDLLERIERLLGK